MFTLSKAFRLPPRFLPVRTFASTAVTQAPPSADGDDLLDIIRETHNSQLEDDLPDYSQSNIRVWSPERLKRIIYNKTVHPSIFSMKGRLRRPIPIKRPYLGPSGPESRRTDVFHQLGIDPLRECLNGNLLSNYLTDMGRVVGRADTKLTWRSQRRVTKAIRRSKMMGIIPLHSKRNLLRGY